MVQKLRYPYMPADGSILYVDGSNGYMQAARAIARDQSLDVTMPTGSVVVYNDTIVGRGANGSSWHQLHGCKRARLGIATGQGYALCEGCHPRNHSEVRAISDALQQIVIVSLQGAELYLWGHWWCCQPCWTVMLGRGIKTVYLLEHSERLFNKDHPANIIGQQYI